VGTTHRKWFTRRRAIVGVGAVAFVGAGLGTWLATSSSSAAPLITTTTTVQTISTGTITKSVSSSGTIEPANQADLNFGASGQVNAVKVSVGQPVSAGQALATIDGTSLSASLVQAQATLANDQAQLSTDESGGASSAQLASDSANVASAQSQVTSAQTSLSEATLASTIAGTVASVSLTVGQQVSASNASSGSSNGSNSGSQSTGASSNSSAASSGASSVASSSSSTSSSAQVVVVSTGSYVVNATVDSTSIGQVKVGDQATITVSGATSSIYGTVGSVGLLASTSSGVASFPVVIDVTGNPSGLYGGATATLSIITQQLQGVVVVPTTAIQYSGNNTTVSLDSNGKKVSRVVQIGAASGGETQVTSGLSVGDKVYVTQVTFRGGPRSGAGASGSGLFGGTGSGGFPGGGNFRGGGFGG
jgi:membrane fusion protein, macrolide-specific efflux system